MKQDITFSGDSYQLFKEHPEKLFFVELLICLHKQDLLNIKNLKILLGTDV